MSVLDRLEGMLARGQAMAESLMVDECAITREIGEAMDPASLRMVPEYATVYLGKCRVKTRSGVARTPEAGEQALTLVASELQLPAGETAVILPDDPVTLTASVNPSLVGREYRVVSETPQTHATKRVLQIEEPQ